MEPELQCIEFGNQCLSDIHPFYFLIILSISLIIPVVVLWGITKIIQAFIRFRN